MEIKGEEKKQGKQHYNGFVELGALETVINWSIWVPLCVSSFGYAHFMTQKYHHYISPAALTAGWFGLPTDLNDSEWSSFVNYLVQLTSVSTVFSLTSVFVRFKFPAFFCLFQVVMSLVLLSMMMSLSGVVYVGIHAFLFFCTVLTGSLNVVWTWSIVMIYFLPGEEVWEITTKVFPLDEDKKDLVIVGLLMCYLRFLSYGCHVLGSRPKKASLFHLFHFSFYLPLFFNGPLLTYDLFDVPLQERKEIDVYDVTCSTLTSLVYGCALHMFFSLVHTTAMASHFHILYRLSSLESMVLMWMLIQVFYVKYVVFYRSSGVYVKLDGLLPPEPPQCITSLYTFSHMWRYFDCGLHRFLGQAIYVPLGGSRRGVVRQLFASLCCFSFVAHWHTGTETMWLWAIFNYLGVAVESGVSFVIESGEVDGLLKVLPAKMYRRLCAVCGAFLVVALIWSNVIFLVGYKAAFVIILQSLSDGFSTFLFALIALYFCCQCSIDCM